MELWKLSEDLEMLAAHLDGHLHCVGVRVVAPTVVIVRCKEGVEFEQEGTDVGVLVAALPTFSERVGVVLGYRSPGLRRTSL
jgi:hypothetical protein